MKFKIGDKVKVKTDLIANEPYGAEHFVKIMDVFKGQVSTVEGYDTAFDAYHLHNFKTSFDTYWNFTDDMLEPVTEPTECEPWNM